jgi:exopolysaccharide biosynthesis polyprenyl glycosylphosphotransferase
LLVPRITPPLPTHRAEAVLLPLAATLGVGLWRLVYAAVFVQPAFQRRLLVLGAGWAGRALVQAIREAGNGARDLNRATGYMVLGFVDDDSGKAGTTVEGLPVLGTRSDLRRLVRELHPDELALAITNAGSLGGEFFQSILDCRESGLQLTTMANLYERISGRVPVQHAGRDLNVVMPLERPAGHRLYMGVRRAADILIGAFGCLVVALLCLPIWIANRFTSPGSVLYWQDRVGKGGRAFSLVKFRSMQMDAEKESGAVWAAANDQRITPAGRFLRRTRLDEFPQFWNVLKGEMSLVGPRPERPVFVARLSREIPFYRLRHAVKPGITGWAQVRHGYAASDEDSLVKLQYDLYYIKHKGPYLDILILMRTAGVMLGLKGR